MGVKWCNKRRRGGREGGGGWVGRGLRAWGRRCKESHVLCHILPSKRQGCSVIPPQDKTPALQSIPNCGATTAIMQCLAAVSHYRNSAHRSLGSGTGRADTQEEKQKTCFSWAAVYPEAGCYTKSATCQYPKRNQL